MKNLEKQILKAQEEINDLDYLNETLKNQYIKMLKKASSALFINHVLKHAKKRNEELRIELEKHKVDCLNSISRLKNVVLGKYQFPILRAKSILEVEKIYQDAKRESEITSCINETFITLDELEYIEKESYREAILNEDSTSNIETILMLAQIKNNIARAVSISNVWDFINKFRSKLTQKEFSKMFGYINKAKTTQELIEVLKFYQIYVILKNEPVEEWNENILMILPFSQSEFVKEKLNNLIKKNQLSNDENGKFKIFY